MRPMTCDRPKMFTRLRAATVGVLLLTACAEESADSGTEHAEQVTDIGPASAGLRLGDRGPEVRFVHDYLRAFGYFPNYGLARRNPGWRPLLAEAPADPELFDEILERGVRGFQEFNQLSATGVVDAETLQLMQSPRCGEPDNFAGSGEKFVHDNLSLGEGACAVANVNGTKEITYRTEETDSQWINAFVSALNEWSRVSSLRFRRVTSGGCIILKPRRALTNADFTNPSGSEIAVNKKTYNTSNNKVSKAEITIGTRTPGGSSLSYFMGQTPDSSKLSARVVLLHEIGHTFGLDHSSHPAIRGDFSRSDQPIMTAGTGNGDDSWLLTDDDVHGLHFKINTANFRSTEAGTAKSMDVSRAGDLWEVSNTEMSDNGAPLRCNGQTLDGAAASHVAVDNTRAWHTNEYGEAYRNRFVGCGAAIWDFIDSDAPLSFIAANGDGKVWALGKDIARGAQDRRVYKYNGTRFVEFGGFGTRIAVDVKGAAWHTNQSGELYKTTADGLGWTRVFSSGYENVHAGKNSFVWLMTKNGHQPVVLNSLDSPWPRVNLGYQNMADAFSDGDSRIYVRDALIPTNGGPEFGGGSLITIR